MAFGYRYKLERQENGWWLVRFPGIPEALSEGETEEEARANARDCVVAALEGYMKAGRPLPRQGAGHTGRDRAVLPSLVTAKLAVYETMRAKGWSKLKLAKQLGMPENSVRRLLDLRHSSHMWIVDEALAKLNAELPIDLPKPRKLRTLNARHRSGSMVGLPEEMNDLIEEYDNRAWNALNSFTKEIDKKEPPKLIYHYTDDAGLHGILQSGMLRLSDIFRLNDPSELKHGFSYAVDMLKEIAKDASDDVRRFADNFEQFNVGGGIEQSGHFFVCCFSGDGDELGQWRAYANDGHGCALGFETGPLEQAFIKPIEREHGPPLQPSTFRITYDDDKLVEIQREILEAVFPLISFPGPTMHPIAKNAFWKELSVRHAANVVSAVLFFKHKAYKNEDEYRFLQLFPRDRPAPGTSIRFRPYSLVRYREFNWRELARNSLKRIVIGPAADKTRGAQFVNDCLEAFDLLDPKVEVTHSSIPYRTP